MKKVIKIIIKIFSIFIIFFLFSNVILAPIIVNNIFNRYDVNYDIEYGLSYEDIKDTYIREEIYYNSRKSKLCGYYYDNSSDKTIVLSHGIHNGADSLLNVMIYFYQHGYNVFSYDSSGANKSSGKALGFTESLIDLKYSLDYIKQFEKTKNTDIYLFGFSWGGYASCAILNYDYDIKGVCSVSGYNDSYNLISSIGYRKFGFIVAFGDIPIKAVLKSTFGDYVYKKGVDGINNKDINTIIIHGINDKVINIDKDSIICKKDKINNPNVSYLKLDRGHGDILYSDEAIEYQNYCKNNHLKSNEIDNFKYSELNNDLFAFIITKFS